MAGKQPELPGYEFLEKIAGGGTSAVWKAKQLSLERLVAIKILSPENTMDPDAMRQFRHEAMAAAKLKDPGIVQIFDAGEYTNIAYIVMEYIPGSTIHDQLKRRGNFSEEDALAAVQWVALALRYAWKNCGIIHCDIKPNNIIVSENGDIRITDLGIAQVVNTMTQSVAHKEFVCTPNYASPEHIAGKVKLDCRTDIYSLGATLYQLLTGIIPFGDLPPNEVLEQQLLGHLEDPRKINPGLSDSTTAVLHKMLARSLDDRYADWDEVIEDFRALRKGYAPPNAHCPAGHSSLKLNIPLSLPEPAPRPIKKPMKKAAGEKKKLTLNKEEMKSIPLNNNRKKRSGCSGCFLFCILLIAGIAALLAFTPIGDFFQPYRENIEAYIDYYMPMNTESESDSIIAAPTSYVPDSHSKTPADKSSDAEEPQLRAKWTNPASGNRVASKNPATTTPYEQGMQRYKEARTLFDSYIQDRKDENQLIVAEKKCREAIDFFNESKRSSDSSKNIQPLIDKCYHLISDCHHSRQLTL